MFTDNHLRLSGSLTAAAAAFSGGAPTGYPIGQAITDTVVTTNLVDLSQHTGIGLDLGEGKPLYFVWAVTIAVSSIATVTFEILANDQEDLTTTPVVLASTGAITEANLTAGTKIALQIPPALASLGYRYLGGRYTCSESGTASFTCDITDTIQDGMKFYASGFSLT